MFASDGTTLSEPGARSTLAAAGLVLLTGVAAILLRPPIPLDETRYLEVLREMVGGEWLVPHLNGEPYADKPPLAFWIARAVHALGLPLELSLRLLPALAAAGTVLLVQRVARRTDAGAAGWMLAGMALPLAYTQFTLVDPLLSLFVWWSLSEWAAGRDLRASAAAALAFLTKGPVAALHIAFLAWALAPLRPASAGSRGAAPAAGPRVLGRIAAVVLAASLPLAIWALAAAQSGGVAFRRDLMVDQTAGRMVDSFAHRHSALYYLPFVALGALPLTPWLLSARPGGRLGRVPVVLGALLLCFSAISGKQPHYLLPLFPALALWASEGLAGRLEAGLARLRLGALLLVGALAAVPILGAAATSRLGRYGEYQEALRADWRWWALLAAALVGALVCLAAVARTRRGPAGVLAPCALALLSISLPAHFAIGRLVLPQRLAERLRAQPERPLATYACAEAGYYNWIARRDRIEDLRSAEVLLRWIADHPDGMVIAQDRHRDAPATLGLRADCADRLRGRPCTLWVEPPRDAAAPLVSSP